MEYILFVYLSTVSTAGGVAVTSAEFSTKEKCEIAAKLIKDDFDTLFTQTPKTICVEK